MASFMPSDKKAALTDTGLASSSHGSGKQQPAPLLELAETVDDFAYQFGNVCFGGRMSKYWALSADL
ncbi:MAG: hypothetical protein RIA09_12520 [Hoeflea sp.]|uniref:hypothetical protein n=1 Tax=Hoeflea sp. TaxID=1940281 RepID=UPI0032EC72C6